MMNKTYSAGEYIDAWCTKCKLELGHTIVAMVDNSPKKVKCNTCGGEHNYRGRPLVKSRKTSQTSNRTKKNKATDYYEIKEKLIKADLSKAQKYSIKGNFEKNEIIDHPVFGAGIVLAVINKNKIEILFKDGLKRLIQNK